jgi:hypothetical protein
MSLNEDELGMFFENYQITITQRNFKIALKSMQQVFNRLFHFLNFNSSF